MARLPIGIVRSNTEWEMAVVSSGHSIGHGMKCG